MGSVFVSYRHVEPDCRLAGELEQFLSLRGIAVFRDSHMQIGDEWADRIDRQLRSAQFLVVFLSTASVQSAYVREEVRLAHDLGIAILPVQIDLEVELPYSIGPYLSGRQIRSYSRLGMHTINNEILSVVQRQSAEQSFGGTEPDLQPETGTVSLDSPYYVRRSVDERIEARLRRPGDTTLLRGPRQVGKSSLLVRAGARAKTEGLRVSRIDFQLLDEEHRQSLSALLKRLAYSIASDFETKVSPDQVWDDRLGAKTSLTRFMESAVLRETTAPVVLCLDEVDLAFGTSYCQEFFAMLRVWHNRRAEGKLWKQLHMVISHSTDPLLWIADLNQSPFNVGERHSLSDFTEQEVRDLTKRYGVQVDPGELMLLVGGHPFLVRSALYDLRTSSRSLENLRSQALREDGPFSGHLEHLKRRVTQDNELREAMRQVLIRRRCQSEQAFQRLQAAGLVRGDSSEAVSPRCELYRMYFSKHLSAVSRSQEAAGY